MPRIPSVPDLVKIIQDIQRRLQNLERANPLESTTIGQGTLELAGGSIILDGGDFVLRDTTGTVLFRIGAQQYGDRGITAYRADGSVAFRVAKIFGPSDTQQRFQFFDLSGVPVGGDAALSQSGFDSPHMPHTWRPIDRSDARTVTSATALNTWVSLFEHRGVRGNPGLPITFSVLCSDGTTAGNIQVLDMASGTPMAAFFAAPWVGAIPAGTTTETFITSPSLVLTELANTTIRLQVQVQRTAGTGTISVAIAQSVGGSA